MGLNSERCCLVQAAAGSGSVWSFLLVHATHFTSPKFSSPVVNPPGPNGKTTLWGLSSLLSSLLALAFVSLSVPTSRTDLRPGSGSTLQLFGFFSSAPSPLSFSFYYLLSPPLGSTCACCLRVSVCLGSYSRWEGRRTSWPLPPERRGSLGCCREAGQRDRRQEANHQREFVLAARWCGSGEIHPKSQPASALFACWAWWPLWLQGPLAHIQP